MLEIFIYLNLVIVYFIPTIISLIRRNYHSDSDIIMIMYINLITGWSIIGYFVALFWAINYNPFNSK